MYACKSSQRTHGENNEFAISYDGKLRYNPSNHFQFLAAKLTSQPQTSEGRHLSFVSVFAFNDGGNKSKIKKKRKKTLGGGVCTPPHAPVYGPGLVLPSDSR